MELVDLPDLESGVLVACGFESHLFDIWEYGSMVEQNLHTIKVGGSIPSTPIIVSMV